MPMCVLLALMFSIAGIASNWVLNTNTVQGNCLGASVRTELIHSVCHSALDATVGLLSSVSMTPAQASLLVGSEASQVRSWPGGGSLYFIMCLMHNS